jgi:hypothetical protein
VSYGEPTDDSLTEEQIIEELVRISARLDSLVQQSGLRVGAFIDVAESALDRAIEEARKQWPSY